MKTHIITFGGAVGGGKSTAGKIVAERLGYRHYSNGGFMRDLARARGQDFIEFNKVLETTSPESVELNKRIDTSAKDFIGDGGDVVVDAHVGFHFFPESFKVYLDITPDIAAERIFKQHREDEQVLSQNEMLELVAWRNQSIQDRFKKLYSVDIRDHSHYDLVIDSGKVENDIETVVEKVITEYQKWLNS